MHHFAEVGGNLSVRTTVKVATKKGGELSPRNCLLFLMRCLVRLSNSVCFGVCWLHVWLDGRGIGFLLEWIVSKAIGIQRYQ